MVHQEAREPDTRGNAAPPSRRERLREATLREIKDIARHHLAEHGPAGISLRAIAREMGMTAPALYRYFASLEELLESLEADFFAELSAHVRSCEETLPADDTDGRILASLRAFRRWALRNQAEFAFLFGPPSPQRERAAAGTAIEAGQRFAAIFFALFDRLLQEHRFTVPDEAELSPALCRQLELFARNNGFTDDVSNGALRVLTSCWIRLYGLISIEAFHHMSSLMEDMEPLFEYELKNVLTQLGVDYRAP
ncbi:TetR family transcriptional regulator [Haloactinospora alba]|uniref:TetR family transcriptional regulator n=1 Tax=Haloactinospora alba TaxID=405555 RepID=A0A543NJG3_9ACTN|nr:TetR/AcrR family transcriptional regulator [Haloactinospora alba]TQN31910.1 TetR family transcriptional regulator [Haloactinospora alba]